ncbi:hypothetical protein PMIN01_07741 [Paraphaeosphaeria minitans]|uniref:Uncharacterized protein n=1 Tax=Paraphaeosphaeria minitans TaxID=565426 RepID=A0A9P6GGC7_9PLEO|nr:hypothetical protein PMIN01_07741 [Paraphaeosphaeria minitans]
MAVCFLRRPRRSRLVQTRSQLIYYLVIYYLVIYYPLLSSSSRPDLVAAHLIPRLQTQTPDSDSSSTRRRRPHVHAQRGSLAKRVPFAAEKGTGPAPSSSPPIQLARAFLSGESSSCTIPLARASSQEMHPSQWLARSNKTCTQRAWVGSAERAADALWLTSSNPPVDPHAFPPPRYCSPQHTRIGAPRALNQHQRCSAVHRGPACRRRRRRRRSRGRRHPRASWTRARESCKPPTQRDMPTHSTTRHPNSLRDVLTRRAMICALARVRPGPRSPQPPPR